MVCSPLSPLAPSLPPPQHYPLYYQFAYVIGGREKLVSLDRSPLPTLQGVLFPRGESYTYRVHLVVYVYDAFGCYTRSTLSSSQDPDSRVTVNPAPLTLSPSAVGDVATQRLALNQPGAVLVATTGYIQMSADAVNPCATLNCGAYGVCFLGSCLCNSGYTGGRCQTPPVPINGTWGNYTNYGPCTLSCGTGGEQVATRTCSPPQYGGLPCAGRSFQSVPCPTTCSVVINGDLSAWTAWSNCSSTCPGGAFQGYFPGTQIRTRSCTSPPPSKYGKTCLAQGLTDTYDSRTCLRADAAWCLVSSCESPCMLYIV